MCICACKHVRTCICSQLLPYMGMYCTFVLYICTYLRTYACINVRTQIITHVHTYACDTNTYMRARVHIIPHAHTYAREHTHTCMHVLMHMRMHVHPYECTYYTFIIMHVFAHLRMQVHMYVRDCMHAHMYNARMYMHTHVRTTHI